MVGAYFISLYKQQGIPNNDLSLRVMLYASATLTFTDNNNNGAGFRYVRMWDDGM